MVQIVNNFNAGTVGVQVTDADLADSGTAGLAPGYVTLYDLVDGHHCVLSAESGSEVVWTTADPAAWFPRYYVRFDVRHDGNMSAVNVQQLARVELFDGVDPYDPDTAWQHEVWFSGDGDVWLTPGGPAGQVATLVGVLPADTWITVTLAQDISTGELTFTAHSHTGALLDSAAVTFPVRGVGVRTVCLGRAGGWGSSGGPFWFDNLRCYDTDTPPPVGPHGPSRAEDPVNDPYDPDPPVVVPFDPAVDVVLRLMTTTSSGGDVDPSTPEGSLGANVSTTDMGVGAGVLFDDLTDDRNRGLAVDYRAVAVYNQHPTASMFNIVLYLDSEEFGGATIAVAVDDVPATDVGFAGPQADSIASGDVAPVAVGAFSAPTTAASGLSLGDIGPGQVRVFWVQRSAHDTVDAIDGVQFGITAQVS